MMAIDWGGGGGGRWGLALECVRLYTYCTVYSIGRCVCTLFSMCGVYVCACVHLCVFCMCVVLWVYAQDACWEQITGNVECSDDGSAISI